MGVLWKRAHDVGKDWRHVYKVGRYASSDAQCLLNCEVWARRSGFIMLILFPINSYSYDCVCEGSHLPSRFIHFFAR